MPSGIITGKTNIPIKEAKYKGLESDTSYTIVNNEDKTIKVDVKKEIVTEDVRRDLNNHIDNKSNPHEVTKEQIGLGNVDNTSDLDKPISTATQSALDAKVPNSGDKEINGPTTFKSTVTFDGSTYFNASPNIKSDLNFVGSDNKTKMSFNRDGNLYFKDATAWLVNIDNDKKIRYADSGQLDLRYGDFRLTNGYSIFWGDKNNNCIKGSNSNLYFMINNFAQIHLYERNAEFNCPITVWDTISMNRMGTSDNSVTTKKYVDDSIASAVSSVKGTKLYKHTIYIEDNDIIVKLHIINTSSIPYQSTDFNSDEKLFDIIVASTRIILQTFHVDKPVGQLVTDMFFNDTNNYLNICCYTDVYEEISISYTTLEQFNDTVTEL